MQYETNKKGEGGEEGEMKYSSEGNKNKGDIGHLKEQINKGWK